MMIGHAKELYATHSCDRTLSIRCVKPLRRVAASASGAATAAGRQAISGRLGDNRTFNRGHVDQNSVAHFDDTVCGSDCLLPVGDHDSGNAHRRYG